MDFWEWITRVEIPIYLIVGVIIAGYAATKSVRQYNLFTYIVVALIWPLILFLAITNKRL